MKIEKKKIKIIGIISIIFLIAIATISFALYTTDITIIYETDTGETICNISVDYDETYKTNGIPYFYITVTNYDENTNITDTDIEYTLTISNNGTSNGIFAIVDEDEGAYSSSYSSQVTTSSYTFDTNQSSKTFKVFVKTSNSTSEEIGVLITLNAIQTN